LHFHDEKHAPRQEADWQFDPDLPVFVRTRVQLDEYFAGERREFDVPIRPMGTAFQLRVWEVLLRIPYGVTTTYGAMAREIGQPTAMRAVGAANGRNPISIIVPCHRAIGADGTLTGYAGGLQRKRALLELESTAMPLFGKVAAGAFQRLPATNGEKR
jgi:methylated-DNA-[protein]-cysteine S-methyltransferase